jgi:hypothetical protein
MKHRRISLNLLLSSFFLFFFFSFSLLEGQNASPTLAIRQSISIEVDVLGNARFRLKMELAPSLYQFLKANRMNGEALLRRVPLLLSWAGSPQNTRNSRRYEKPV